MSITGRLAIVTGAGGRIGTAIVEELVPRDASRGQRY